MVLHFAASFATRDWQSERLYFFFAMPQSADTGVFCRQAALYNPHSQ
jgi:hypothetical protein